MNREHRVLTTDGITTSVHRLLVHRAIQALTHVRFLVLPCLLGAEARPHHHTVRDTDIIRTTTINHRTLMRLVRHIQSTRTPDVIGVIRLSTTTGLQDQNRDCLHAIIRGLHTIALRATRAIITDIVTRTITTILRRQLTILNHQFR